MMPSDSIVSGLSNENPAMAGTMTGPVIATKRQLGAKQTELANPFSHSPERRASGAVRMSYPSLFSIQCAVAQRFGLSTLDLISDRRGRQFARPRQLVCWLARHLTLLSMRDIGRGLRRDHTTVIHAVERVDGYLLTDPEIAWAALELRYQLTPRETAA